MAKAHLPVLQTVMLGVVAGGFIGLGALYSTVIVSDPQLTFGLARPLTLAELSRNWLLVYVASAAGAIGLALVVYWSHHAEMTQRAVVLAYLKIAAAKMALPFAKVFFKGVLCNLLVCLAVWIALAGHSVTEKVLAIIFPVSAFVAVGFEHSVANMYFIPLGIFLHDGGMTGEGVNTAALDWNGLAGNLIPVTFGNIVGGSVMVALVYYTIYRHPSRA